MNHEEEDDVMARLFNEELGYTVTIITAPEHVLKEDGPVVNQISNDEIIIIYSDEFVDKKITSAYDNNHEEFGDMAKGIGFAYLMSEAMKAANKKFEASN
jgi:hypothetical protein